MLNYEWTLILFRDDSEALACKGGFNINQSLIDGVLYTVPIRGLSLWERV